MNSYENLLKSVQKNVNLGQTKQDEYKKLILSAQQRNLPAILNSFHLSNIIGIRWKTMKQMISKPSDFYYQFDIPKKSGGFRRIDSPSKDLVFVQEYILDSILENLEIHSKATGFFKGRSIALNASFHKNQEMVLCIDLKDFFPNVSRKEVYKIFRNMCSYSKSVSYCLSKLCTLNDALPQGACTSPYLSNLVSLKLDQRLENYSIKNRVNYSRYADDITFSGDYSSINRFFFESVKKIIEGEGFFINDSKTRFQSKNNRQLVTGIIVNNENLSLPREYLRTVRKEIYLMRFYDSSKGKLVSSVFYNYHDYLLGKIMFIKSISECIGNTFLAKFLENQRSV